MKRLTLILAAILAILAAMPAAAKPAHAGPTGCTLTASDTTVAVGELVTITASGCPTNGNKTTYLWLDGGAGGGYGPLGYGDPFVEGVTVTTSWDTPGVKHLFVIQCQGRCFAAARVDVTVT